MNSSENYQNLILRYIDGDLDTKEIQLIESILKENPHAKAFYLEQMDLDNVLAKSFAKTTLSENFESDLLEKITIAPPQPLINETPTIRIILQEFLKQLSDYQDYFYSGLLVLLLITPQLDAEKLIKLLTFPITPYFLIGSSVAILMIVFPIREWASRLFQHSRFF